MKKKIICFFICALFFGASVLPIISGNIEDQNNSYIINLLEQENILSDKGSLCFFDDFDKSEECAGMVATGSVVKDNRSIFWKNRHIDDATPNKPYYFTGDTYKFYGIGVPGNEVKTGMNENGLAIGSFTANSPSMSSKNKQYKSDETKAPNEIRKYILGHFSKVKDAAIYFSKHILVSTGGENTGIVSSEQGVGAIISTYRCDDGYVWSHITWINNTWQPIDNCLQCEGIGKDPDGNGKTIYNIWTDIIKNGGSSDNNHKITWEDVCHLGAKNVNNREKGTGRFFTSGQISRAHCVGAFVAISGDLRFNGALNIGMVQLGRQALVGTFLPLNAFCLDSSSDIPNEFTMGNGIESYVTPKVIYATNGVGQGTETYYCEPVQEIQNYTNHNENLMFYEYQKLLNSIPPSANLNFVKDSMSHYISNMVSMILSAYVSGKKISIVPPTVPTTPFGPATGRPLSNYTFFTNSSHIDGDEIFILWDWGDGTTCEWIGGFSQGESLKGEHQWTMNGTYKIKVKAKVIYSNETTWSESASITIWNNNPGVPTINGETSGNVGEEYEYRICSFDEDGDFVKYYISWGDSSEWNGPYESGDEVIVKHLWNAKGKFTIQVFAQDVYGAKSGWVTLPVTMPYSHNPILQFLDWLFQWFPHAFPILRHMMED